MTRKLFTVAAGLLALALFAGIAFVPASSAAPGRAALMTQEKPAGLTSQGIEIARKANTPSRLVAMKPQSSLELLSQAKNLGPHAKDSKIKLTVSLKLNHVARLKNFLEQVQNTGSPVYHQWLTPEQFTQQYGPTKAQVAKVVKYLKAHGITVKNVSRNRTLIHTEATSEEYEHALRIRVNDYKLDGRRFFSTTDSPVLPRSLAAQVVGVLGLNGGVQFHPHYHTVPLGAAANAAAPQEVPPASTTYFNPHQIATAYDVPDITDVNNASGVGIAIATAASQGVSASSDFSNFWSALGLPGHTVNEIDVDGAPQAGGEGETWLDIEYAGAMGPGATLNVYIAATPSFTSFADTYNQIVENNTSEVMTTSWGIYESGMVESQIQTDEQIFMQAAAQGISVFAAAGDYGTADRNPDGGYNADYPSTSAWVTAANGTQLNISDLAGHYGSEIVWNDTACGQAMATGGAVSSVIARPVWQYGPGVPDDIDMRMNSDVALTASCVHPMIVLNEGEWAGVAGTSAVAPQLAGIFAIADAHQTGGRLGQSNKLFYGDVNAGHYATDFHDVTQGCNGTLPDGSGSCAATNWDHPTGWGSLDVTSLLSHIGSHGPLGTLTGTVTDAASGASLAGATVAITGSHDREYDVTVRKDGSYGRILPAGSYTVKVSQFAYVSTTGSITISDGDTTTRNFTLTKQPLATISGRVSDGSGHGYGLYADIKVSVKKNPLLDVWTQFADTWTDPADGSYSVELPQGSSYKLKVAAAFDGYDTASNIVMLSGNETENFSLKADSVCTAPGYEYLRGSFGEDFNGAGFPPKGWTVTNAIAGSAVVWKPNTVWTDHNGDPDENDTGGTGTAADSNSWFAGNSAGDHGFGYRGPHDTSLVTPPIAVTSLHGRTILLYREYFYGTLGGYNDSLDLDISTDGGETWRTIRPGHENVGYEYAANGGPKGTTLHLNLAPYLPVSGSFRLRWRNYDLDADGWDFDAQIDDVRIGQCVSVPGSLLMGQVTDARTGKAVSGVTVADDLGESTTTLVNSADPNWTPGTYLLFASKGRRTVTASKRYYTPASVALTVPKNKTLNKDVALQSPRLAANPNSVNIHVKAGGSATVTFALSNTGNGEGGFHILQINQALLAAPAAMEPRSLSAWNLLDGGLAGRESRAVIRRGRVGSPHVGGHAHEGSPLDDRPTSWTTRKGSHSNVMVNSSATGGFPYPVDIVEPYTSFNAGLQVLGVGVNHNTNDLWIGSPSNRTYTNFNGDGKDHRFRFNGSDTGDAVDVSHNGTLIMTDMAFDDNTGMFWQAAWSNSAEYGSAIYEINPVTMQFTGRSIDVPTAGWVSHTETSGLAYDPRSDTWYAADQTSGAIQHFDATGKMLDWHTTGRGPTSGLAYNSATGHLFALNLAAYVYLGFPISTKYDGLVIIVYDTSQENVRKGWTPIRAILVNDNHQMWGAYGLDYDCAGDLIFGNYVTNVVTVVPSGETGWCDFKKIPWLTVAPAAGTLAAGASTTVTLHIDGTKRKPNTTSKTYLRINHGTMSGVTLPIIVHWDAPDAPPVAQGGTLTTNENIAANGMLQASDPDGDTLTFSITSQPTHGTVSLDDMTTGAYTYTPDQDYSGSDSFTFKANDGTQDSNVATVKVTVKAVAPPPTPPKDDGGGALGWLALLALLGLSVGTYATRRRADEK